MTESFAELFEQSEKLSKLKPGAIVVGVVVEVRNDVVVINAGLKSEGIVPIEQFRNEEGEIDVGVGDEVKVALDALENGFGETVLSREKAKRAMVWDELEEAMEKSETITGRISGKVKGGFTVDIKDVRAFLPGSLVDVRPVRDPAYLEGKELEFKIIKLDRKRNNVVVSRRAVVESEYSEEREKLMERLVEGAILPGVVKNLTDYGAFVDLGGIDGLLHITDMAWKRVRHPSEVVEVGQELQVRVLKFDRERNRVSLGLKQLGEDPWDNIARRYPNGTRIFGKVSNVTDYGCFVEIEPGVEGLVHVSEMDWTNKNVNPSKVVQVGDETEVMVLDVDEERRRISLGIKQCTQNPWETFAQSFKKGDRVAGQIKSISSLAWMAASMGWSTCPTSAGTPPATTSSATSRRATTSMPWCWRWIRSVSASRWASSSWSRTRSASSWRPTRRAASSTARSRKWIPRVPPWNWARASRATSAPRISPRSASTTPPST
jgi:small subunit ribosomal protein S1